MAKKSKMFKVVISEGTGKQTLRLMATSPKDAREGIKSSFRTNVKIFSTKKERRNVKKLLK